MAKLMPLDGGSYYAWKYVPSMAAAILFLILFLAGTSYHFWKIIDSRVKFTLPFAIGGMFEVIGYAARIDSHNHTNKLMPFCIQSAFILLGPALFAASVYMVLARIIQSVHGEKYSIVPVKSLTKIFVTSDVATFLLQAAGSGMLVTNKLAKLGKPVVITGLVLQVVSFGVFLAVGHIFLIRMRRNSTLKAYEPSVPWKEHLKSLYAISVLILIRSVFRVIEYAMGNDGYPLKYEWTLYVFDSVPMFASMVIFGVWYPSALKSFLEQRDTLLNSL